MADDMDKENSEEKDDEKGEQKKGAPFMPYDITLEDNFHIYDNAEYIRNKALTEEFPRMSSGNIIKHYEQKMSEEAKEIKH